MTQKISNILIVPKLGSPILLTSTTKEEVEQWYLQGKVLKAFLVANSQEIVELNYSVDNKCLAYNHVTAL